jgi:hypothetical protein
MEELIKTYIDEYHYCIANNRCISQIETNELKPEGNLLNFSREMVTNLFDDTKIFKLDDKLINVLLKTRNTIYPREIPFNDFFIAGIFNLGHYSIKGIHISKQPLDDMDGVEEVMNRLRVKYGGEKVNKDWLKWHIGKIKVQFIMGVNEGNKELVQFSYQLFSEKDIRATLKNVDIIEASIYATEIVMIKNVSILICNFLDFLNHPEVETRVIKWFNNENRIKKGKPKINDKVEITIRGKLYRYIYEEYPQMEERASAKHSFPVRGYYRHFWEKNKWKWVYSMELNELKKRSYQEDKEGIRSRWILPSIRGKGLLIVKPYKIKAKSADLRPKTNMEGK